MYKIAVIGGDGIGPEVTEEALKILGAVARRFDFQIETTEAYLGGACIDKFGAPITDETLKTCTSADAVFLGAVGGPSWDHLESAKRPEKGLLALRKGLETYANLRPVKIFPELVSRSPLKKEVVAGVDFLILRELVGGIYFGLPRGISKTDDGKEIGINTLSYTTDQIERIARKGFEFARLRRGSLTSVDKANVLESSQLWRRTVESIHKDYPDVKLDHRYVDDCAMQFIRDPKQFDVVVTMNLFGDILSDESAMLTGSIGMLPSASIGAEHALYEPVHGSAPDIAGKDAANPLAAMLSMAMMTEYSFKKPEAARAIEKAISNVLREGYRTADIFEEGSKKVGCAEMGRLVRQALETKTSV